MATMPGRYEVVGAAVVLKTGTTERYLYRGAVFPTSEFEKDSISHAKTAGLIAPVKAEAKTEDKSPAKSPAKTGATAGKQSDQSETGEPDQSAK